MHFGNILNGQTLTPEQKGKEARVEMKRPLFNIVGSGRTRANYVILLVDCEEERGDSLSGNGNVLDLSVAKVKIQS